MYDAIATLLSSFLAICRFRLSPQDLPSSAFLLRCTILFYFLSSFLLSVVSLPLMPALIVTLADTCFMVAFTLVALRLVNRSIRTTQTLTAQAGTGALLAVAFLPLVATQTSGPVVSDSVELNDVLQYALVFLSWMIQGHIFRHAFSTSLTVGVAVALVNFWMQYTLLEAVVTSLVRL